MTLREFHALTARLIIEEGAGELPVVMADGEPVVPPVLVRPTAKWSTSYVVITDREEEEED
jgi:hypothetical protein